MSNVFLYLHARILMAFKFLFIPQVRSHLQEGHIERVIDPLLGNNFNMESMWMIARLALQCVELKSLHQPTMSTICEQLTLSMKIDTCSNSSKLWLTIHHKNCL